MIHALFLTASLTLPGQTLIEGPVNPVGISQLFQERSLLIQKLCGQGDFEKAKGLMWMLPRAKFSVEWHGEGLGSDADTVFKPSLEGAQTLWYSVCGERLTFSNKGDVVIRYADVKLTQLKFGETPSQPYLTAVFPLKRGDAGALPTEVTVQNDLSYAVGTYLGIGRHSLLPSPMTHSGDDAGILLRPIPIDQIAGSNAGRVVEVLNLAIQNKVRYKAGLPKARMEEKSLSQEPLLRGEKRLWTFPLTNDGTSPLVFRISTDCGCLAATPNGMIQPGQTQQIQVLFDSTEFSGDVAKRVSIVTNDPSFGVRNLQYQIRVNQLYDLSGPERKTIIVEKDETEFDVVIRSAKKDSSRLISAVSGGIDAKLTTKAVSGIDEKGMFPFAVVKVKVNTKQLKGRQQFSLSFNLDDPKFPVITENYFLQKGIAAVPEELYFGSLNKNARSITVEVTRPNKPFKIKKFRVDNAAFQVIREGETSGSTYFFRVDYLGTAFKGSISATVLVETDDPNQPTIKIPIRGTVK